MSFSQRSSDSRSSVTVGASVSGTRGGDSVAASPTSNSPANRGGGGRGRGGSAGTGNGRAGGSGRIVLRHPGATPLLVIPGVTAQARVIDGGDWQVYDLLSGATISLL